MSLVMREGGREGVNFGNVRVSSSSGVVVLTERERVKRRRND